jgi:hypothetical protein
MPTRANGSDQNFTLPLAVFRPEEESCRRFDSRLSRIARANSQLHLPGPALTIRHAFQGLFSRSQWD